MADPLIVTGRVGEPFSLTVEEGKVREFAAATHQPDDGVRPRRSPVTFLASSALWMAPENNAWHGIERDLRRVLHGEQEFLLPHGPLPVGTTLVARQRIDATYEKQGSRGTMTFTEIVTEFAADPIGSPVAVMRATSITLEHPPPAAGPSASAAEPSVPDAPPGHRLIATVVEPPLTVTDFVRYQGASGDFNPIHHDTEFARSAGYPGPFAVGMLTAGIAAAVTIGSGGRDLGAVRRYTTRWKSPAWPGEALSYHVYERLGTTDLYTHVVRPTGETHLQAWTAFAAGPDPARP